MSAGEAGERVGLFLGRIGQRLSGTSAVARQTVQPAPRAIPEQWRPEPRRLSQHQYDTAPSALPPIRLVPRGGVVNSSVAGAVTVAQPDDKRSPSASPIVRLFGGPATGAHRTPADSPHAQPAAGSRKRDWILALEVTEILAHVPPFRNVLHRVLGPRGADLLFLGTSLVGLLLPFHDSGSIDGSALLMVAARFALGFLIEPWWIDLLFGIAGIGMFLLERRRHRQALATG